MTTNGPQDWPQAWIDNLAQAEIETQETGNIDAFGHLNAEKILHHHTISFLKELKNVFQASANRFNELRQDSRQTIKIYGIAQTDADFLVFRNSLKLVGSYVKAGQIEISFHTLSGGLFAPQKITSATGKNTVPKPPGSLDDTKGDLLDIELGPFNEAYWTFKGIRVDASAIARFYLTEFIKNSAS